MPTGNTFPINEANTDWLLDDPGQNQDMAFSTSGVCLIDAQAAYGSDTREVKAPAYVGQRVTIGFKKDSSGTTGGVTLNFVDEDGDAAYVFSTNSSVTMQTSNTGTQHINLLGIEWNGKRRWVAADTDNWTAA